MEEEWAIVRSKSAAIWLRSQQQVWVEALLRRKYRKEGGLPSG
jgi:hypothetical protein